MSVSRENIITAGYSGTFGKQMILRNCKGRSIMSNIHDYRNHKWTEAQKENRDRFRWATCWAREEFCDPRKKKYYTKRAKGLQTGYNVAIGDYMRNLRIREVHVSDFGGEFGNPIRVTLKKPFGATTVRCYIIGPGNVTIETGTATCSHDGITWTYKSNMTKPSLQPVKIEFELIRGPVTMYETYNIVKGILLE